MKLCKDCKHLNHNKWSCERQVGVNISPIDGGIEPIYHRWIWAKVQRSQGKIWAWLTNSCGKEGKFWEAK
jgi:hypothetical protein